MGLQGKKVLVTGAGGFIGSHLTEALLTEKAIVKAFVKYNSRNDWGWLEDVSKHPELSVCTGNLTDFDAVCKATADCDIVFHLGSLIAIPYSYENPRDVFETNVMGTYNVMKAALEHKCKIIHTSTSEVYGTAKSIPIKEDHPLHGQSPYSASKIGADKVAESFHKSFNLDVTTIRPFNTYGTRQSARAFVPTVITQALTQKTIHVGNLEPKRDMNFVIDTVKGFLLASQADCQGEIINLCSNKTISMKDLVNMIKDLVNPKLVIKVDDQRIRPDGSEVMLLQGDNSKALKLLNWKPGTELESGVQQTVDWIKKNLNRYKTGIYNI